MKDCTLTHSLLPKCICELECCNFLLGNPCIPHGSDQHCPCGSWVPLAPHHLISPSCTAFSFCGLAVKHAAIVGASSPTLSRSTLPLPAVILLTCFMKSMRWSGRPTERARHFTSMLCPRTHIHACMQTVTDLHIPHTTGSTTHQPHTTLVVFALSVVAEAVLPPVVAEAVLPPVVAEAAFPPVVAEAVLPPVAAEAVLPRVVAEAVLPPVVAEAVLPPVVHG